MDHQQLPLFDTPVTKSAWRDMGYALELCPGCGEALAYPAEVICYAVVCPCGWGAIPVEDGKIVWLAPQVTKDLIRTRFWATNSQN